MKRIVLSLGILVLFTLSSFSQTYWSKERISITRKELANALVNNKIQFNNEQQKEDFLNCVIAKLVNGFPKGIDNITKSDTEILKSYNVDCFKSTLDLSTQNNIKNATVTLDWSNMNTLAFKNQIYKQIKLTGKYSDSDAEKISNCVVKKAKIKYPGGIDFSKIELKDYHSDVLQFIKDCLK